MPKLSDVKLRVGSATITKAYVGTKQVWTATVIPTAMAVIGDSLTYQDIGATPTVAASLQAKGWTPTHIDGEIGRPIVNTVSGVSMQTVIDNWRAQGIDPQRWVLALGSNNIGASDSQWITWIGQALAKVAAGGKQYKVWWPGISLRDSVTDTRAIRFWNVISAQITPPANVTLVPIDYNTLIHAGDQTGLWSTTDSSGRHMTVAGYSLRNTILADAIGAPTP